MKNKLKYVFITQSRSGSQFLLNTVMSIVGDKDVFYPQCRFNRTRLDTMNNDDFYKLNLGDVKAINRHIVDTNIKSMKIEEPNIGDFAKMISTTNSKIKWLFSIRKIEDIIISHHNMPWGYNSDYVLKMWRNNLKLYEYLNSMGRPIFAIDVSNPEKNNFDSLVSFLGIDKPTKEGRKVFEEWAVVNDHNRQLRLHGKEEADKKMPKDLENIRKNNLWIDGVEKRYEKLFEEIVRD